MTILLTYNAIDYDSNTITTGNTNNNIHHDDDNNTNMTVRTVQEIKEDILNNRGINERVS